MPKPSKELWEDLHPMQQEVKRKAQSPGIQISERRKQIKDNVKISDTLQTSLQQPPTDVDLWVRMKTGGRYADINFYLWDGSEYYFVAGWACVASDYEDFKVSSNVYLEDVFNSIAKVNGAKLKMVHFYSGDPSHDSWFRVTKAWLTVTWNGTNYNLPVNGREDETQEWTTYGTFPYIDTADEDLSYIHSPTYTYTTSGWTFQDIGT